MRPLRGRIHVWEEQEIMGISAAARLRVGLAVAVLAAGALGAVALPGTVSSSTAATAPYCGPTVLKSNGTPWTCTFADEFGGWRLDRNKWTPLTTAHTGIRSQECRVDETANLQVWRGALRLTVRKERAPVTCHAGSTSYNTWYTGAGVSTGQKFSQKYGRFEIRAAFPRLKVKGLHSALWMWPQATKYASHLSGEIDIAEFRTGVPDRVVPTLHYLGEADDWASNWNCYVYAPERYHTYGLEWTPTSMTFRYDGRVCWSHSWKPAAPLTNPSPFDEPFFLIMNQSLGSGLNNAFDPATTTLPGSMYVDYVHAWK